MPKGNKFAAIEVVDAEFAAEGTLNDGQGSMIAWRPFTAGVGHPLSTMNGVFQAPRGAAIAQNEIQGGCFGVSLIHLADFDLQLFPTGS